MRNRFTALSPLVPLDQERASQFYPLGFMNRGAQSNYAASAFLMRNKRPWQSVKSAEVHWLTALVKVLPHDFAN
jgi:hypothetical protein